MTDVEPVVTDFAATGRTGRRNAVPDIVEAGPADLSDKLAELSMVESSVCLDSQLSINQAGFSGKGIWKLTVWKMYHSFNRLNGN
uniref:cAMP-dependent protein kinase inhibitor beta n=1 Tax=Oncorhynchus kisutch TaxID=8019 RepID=A0A8C7J960_ONCKI